MRHEAFPSSIIFACLSASACNCRNFSSVNSMAGCWWKVVGSVFEVGSWSINWWRDRWGGEAKMLSRKRSVLAGRVGMGWWGVKKPSGTWRWSSCPLIYILMRNWRERTMGYVPLEYINWQGFEVKAKFERNLWIAKLSFRSKNWAPRRRGWSWGLVVLLEMMLMKTFTEGDARPLVCSLVTLARKWGFESPFLS